MEKQNLIVEMTEKFAIKIIDFHIQVKNAGVPTMAEQLFKSGTSVGANVSEAQNAESRKDFIHKLKIAAKEGDETAFWLKLRTNSSHLPDPGELSAEIKSINRVLNRIISSAKQNSPD